MSQPSAQTGSPAEQALEADLVVEGGELTALHSSDSGTSSELTPEVMEASPAVACKFPDLLPLATLFAGKQVHVVYFFSGVKRKGDVKSFLQMFCDGINTAIRMHEVDLLHPAMICQSSNRKTSGFGDCATSTLSYAPLHARISVE